MTSLMLISIFLLLVKNSMLIRKNVLTLTTSLDIIMTNLWNYLSDSAMSNQDYWEEDGISLTGNPGAASPDTIKFTMSENEDGTLNLSKEIVGSRLPGGMGEDHISFNYNNDFHMNLVMPEKTDRRYKYSEDRILKELDDYISGTYNQHYSAGDDKIQTLDLIEACGDGEAFCRSNILKYASRYDKKGTARRDIMKILHYAVLLLHFNDKNAQRETYPQ
jgi:hypothetical protein